MKFRAKLGSFALFAVAVLFISGCTSYNIKYPVELKNKTINAELVIPEIPKAVNLVEPAGLLPAALYASTLKPKIVAAYNEVELKKIIIEEFKNNGAKLNKLVSVIVSEGTANLVVPTDILTDEEYKANPYQSKYRVEEANPKIKSPYLFEFKVIAWGHDGKNARARIDFHAAIYDVKTKKPVWIYFAKISKAPSAFSTNIKFNKEKATKFMQAVVHKAVDKCMDDIAKK